MKDTTISDRVGHYFDKRARQFHRVYHSKDWLEHTANRILRRAIYARSAVMAEETARLPSPTVLDVGSGTGVNAFAALERGARHVLGVDLATTMVEMARQGAIEHGVADRCEFKEGDFTTWPEDQRFDLVTALGVFDYVGDAEAFLRKMCRLADRSVVASFPGRGVRGRIRQVRYEMRGCPLFLFEENQVRDWVAKEGFTDVLVPFKDSSGFVLVARR